MKRLLVIGLFLLTVGFTFGISNASTLVYSGCGYVCYSETIQYPVEHHEYMKVMHREPFEVEKKVVRLVRVPPVKGEHDCLDYKKWDLIVKDIDSGIDTGYNVKDGKLFTNSGKRYLRCNDPDNPYNFKKLVDTITETEYKDVFKDELVTRYSMVSEEVLRCFYTSTHSNGHGVGHGYDYGNGNGNGYGHRPKPDTSPVPEPTTMLLLGTGLLGLAGIYRLTGRKK